MTGALERLQEVARTWRWRPVAVQMRHNGPQLLFRFPNGYGISVVGEIDQDEWLASMELVRLAGGKPWDVPMPLRSDVVELACIRWYETDGPFDAATNGFDLASHRWPGERWEDSVARYVALGEVEALFASVEARS